MRERVRRVELPGDDDDFDATTGDDGSPIFVSHDGGDLDGSGVHAKSLTIVPSSQTITVDGVTPGTATYTVLATLDDGTVETVAAQSLQFDRPDLASVTQTSPVTLSLPGAYAGTGTLHAVFGGATATATLNVVVHERVLGNVPSGTATTLDGATTPDPSLTSLLYPYDATVWPLGLTSPLVMWSAPHPSGDTYRLHLEQSNYTYDAYAAVAAPGRFRIDQTTWDDDGVERRRDH